VRKSKKPRKPGKTRKFKFLKIQKSRHKAHGRKSCRRDNCRRIPVSEQNRILRIHSNTKQMLTKKDLSRSQFRMEVFAFQIYN